MKSGVQYAVLLLSGARTGGRVVAFSGSYSALAQTLGDVGYTTGDEIRVMDPASGTDWLVWSVPDTIFSISKLIWNPAGTETPSPAGARFTSSAVVRR